MEFPYHTDSGLELEMLLLLQSLFGVWLWNCGPEKNYFRKHYKRSGPRIQMIELN